jgi:hypothetical protein
MAVKPRLPLPRLTAIVSAALNMMIYRDEEANRLNRQDEVVAESGGPITFTLVTNPQNQANAEGIQTLLAQVDGLEVSIETVSSPATENGHMGIVLHRP